MALAAGDGTLGGFGECRRGNTGWRGKSEGSERNSGLSEEEEELAHNDFSAIFKPVLPSTAAVAGHCRTCVPTICGGARPGGTGKDVTVGKDLHGDGLKFSLNPPAEPPGQWVLSSAHPTSHRSRGRTPLRAKEHLTRDTRAFWGAEGQEPSPSTVPFPAQPQPVPTQQTPRRPPAHFWRTGRGGHRRKRPFWSVPSSRKNVLKDRLWVCRNALRDPRTAAPGASGPSRPPPAYGIFDFPSGQPPPPAKVSRRQEPGSAPHSAFPPPKLATCHIVQNSGTERRCRHRGIRIPPA